jgi:DNA (cytosine-5)-methyltransferase 1
MTPITYGSVCSGIEGASVAWAPLGWRCAFMAETEAFPRAVLKHHYADTPLYSDFTHLRDGHREALAEVDVLVGGTPCQGFSVAGLRGSLSDDRSNLCLEFIRLADAIDDLRRAAGREPCWVLWENVPGVFSTDDNAFGAFLGGLVGSDAALDAGPRGRWTDAGVAAGPQRMAAWRVLDAQHFGLAQRRRRVFVLAVGGAGAWRCADALLPLADSLQGHPAPRRQAREGVARPIAGSSPASSGYRNDADTADNLIAGAMPAAGGTERKHGQGWGQQEFEAGYAVPVLTSGLEGGDIARALNGCHTASGRHDISVDTFVAPSLRAQAQPSHRADSDTYVAHSLRADGFDASEDGTGRGTPLIAFTKNDAGGDIGEDISPTLRAGEFAGSHANAGVMPAIAFNWQNGGGYGDANDGLGITEEATGPLDASTVKAVAIPITADAMRGEGTALTPSADAAGRVRLRDPGLGIGEDGDPASTLATSPGAVFTLASRGRGDTHQLEFRDDELANALLTPNGGRGGIGVGAVALAYDDPRRFTGPHGGLEHGDLHPTLESTNPKQIVAFDAVQLTHPENRSNPQPGDPAPTLAEGSDPMVVDLQNVALGGSEVAGTIDTSRPSRGGGQAVAFNITPSQSNKDFNARPSEHSQALTPSGNRVSARGGDLVAFVDAAPTLSPGHHGAAGHQHRQKGNEGALVGVAGTLSAAMGRRAGQPNDDRNMADLLVPTSAVRRLTPTECERLQGFPDGYTDVPYRNKPAADGPRYKALGNSFATPVIRWIGERIAHEA